MVKIVARNQMFLHLMLSKENKCVTNNVINGRNIFELFKSLSVKEFYLSFIKLKL